MFGAEGDGELSDAIGEVDAPRRLDPLAARPLLT